MRLTLRQLWLVSHLTALETMRQPVCLLLTATCLSLMALLPLLIAYQFGEDGKLVRDSALALHSVFGLCVAGYAAGSALSREIRSGTAATILSKRITRETFFLAKFLGVCAVVLFFSLCAAIGTLLSERAAPKMHIADSLTGGLFAAVPAVAFAAAGIVNYRRRTSFVTNAFAWLLGLLALVFVVTAALDRAGRWTSFGSLMAWRLLPASVLVTLLLVALSAIALSLSTRLSPAPALGLLAAVFALGLMSDHVFGRFAAGSVPAAVLYGVIPNWQHFWLADALTGGGTISWSYVALAGAYAALYIAGVLFLGLLAFRRAEITQQAV